MGLFSAFPLLLLPLLILLSMLATHVPLCDALRFVIDKKECWSHVVPNDGSTVHVSFVVIKSESSWNFDPSAVGLDLVVEAPAGHQVHSSKQKTEEKFVFVAIRRGLYKFCFYNRNSIHETVDFDFHVGHITPSEEHVKDEHIEPLMLQIERLEEALYSVQFEQHWLLAQTDRQAIVNKGMSRRVLYKMVLEALALVGSSVLQVVLLRRLFERRLGQSRV